MNIANFDVVVIGAGPSGLFCAFQAGMLGMKVAVVDSLENVGGQCSALYPEKIIYDIPGYPKIVSEKFIEKLRIQADIFSPQYFLAQQVTTLENHGNFFKLKTSNFNEIQGKVVVIAAGAGSFYPHRPYLENIELYEEKSVFYSVKSKKNFSGKNLVIAGGGNSAFDWAISLSKIANVSLVHRRDKFRAATGTINTIYELEKLGKIKLITNHQVSSLVGENGNLKKIIINDLDNNRKLLDADILLLFLGMKQNLGPILNFGLNIYNGHIEANYPYFETNIPGVYAVGDIATYKGKLKLILTGFAESASAMHHAYSRIFEGKALRFKYSTTKKL